jgi:RNA polymerase sigma-70 factor (ECF subfamily)
MVDWDAIVTRDGPAVWRTVYRIVGNRADAEDCFQETFLSALAVWRREAVSNPHALLQRMATARALDRLRRRYRRKSREGASAAWDDLPSDGQGPSAEAEASELSQRLREALCGIPSKQAEAFCLFALDGWTYEQIAAHFGSSINAVGVLLHRARQRLQDLLKDPTADAMKAGK